MGEAFAWIGQIVEWIGKFFPRWTLISGTYGAVKYVNFFFPRRVRTWVARLLHVTAFNGDQRIEILGPGLHWWWPATTSFVESPTAIQTDDLKTQTLETEDGFSIVVGGQITYHISDLEKTATKVLAWGKFIQTVTLASIHQTCCKMKWADLKQEQRKGTLNTKLRNAVKKDLAPYGVEVDECSLTDLASAFVVRNIQSTQQDELI